ncbi:putative neutral zinc metallopeptidase [Mycoplasma sp. CAG:877]|nr:putative neutral zinc metallopeptidase [Mycoplasma sp. CAG:877]
MEYYLLTILAFLITITAQIFVNGSYSKTRKIKNKHNLTGEEVARTILDKNGLRNVQIEEVHSTLGDHYDPTTKTVRLSSDIYHNTSIASASVAAHECGHAIQDKDDYTFLRIRHALIPIVNFSSYAGYIAIVIGCIFSSINLIWVGILMEIIILLFQLVTLPVEFNASSRALKQLEELNLLEKSEIKYSRKMLGAAAMTYVASVAAAVLEILRLLLIFNKNND